MNAAEEMPELFELELQLPDARLAEISKGLIGFEARFQRLNRDLRLLANPDELRAWSKKYYHRELEICQAISDRYPLIIFAGDVGTGKTATAEGVCDRLARESRREAMLFKLSTRVRGSGKVGQMSTMLNHAFELITKEAGKTRQAFLIIDEADSLTSSREASQAHHEDKVAVNTIIQKVDDLRRHLGRVLVFLCTNRSRALDPAIIRRAARVEQFDRPTDAEREELFRHDLNGLNVPDNVLHELVKLTGPREGRVGFTFSDLRTKFLPEAICRAFPSRAISNDDFLEAAKQLRPSPVVKDA